MPFSKTRSENQCLLCGCVKSPSAFYYGTKRGKKYQIPRCISCHKKTSHEQRVLRSDKIKAAALLKKDQRAAYQKEYRRKNAERLSAFYKERYLRNKQDPSFKEKVAKRAQSARKNNPALRIKEVLSSRLSNFLKSKGASKAGRRILEYVGCSSQELRAHIESQFTKGMNWQNQGFNGWHIDHIIPCSAFDHADDNQLRQCWHFSNLRPMWSRDNLSKGKKITEPQLKLLL